MSHRVLPELIRLCHLLGNPSQDLALYTEGDASARLDAKSLLVKADGAQLGAMDETGLAQLAFEPLLELVASHPNATPARIAQCLRDAAAPGSPMPCTEAFFHAVLLDLPGVLFVGHTHPAFVNAIMCSPKAEAFASLRLFPQQVRCCGPRSLYVPYMDPGLPLAVELRYRLELYQNEFGAPPATVLLGNHGMIALGASPESVIMATTVMQKAAHAYVLAQSCGGAIPIPDPHAHRMLGIQGGN